MAREYSAIFMETSSKDGSNILDSLVMLAREMCASEDVEVSASSFLPLLHMTPPAGADLCPEDPGRLDQEELLLLLLPQIQHQMIHTNPDFHIYTAFHLNIIPN